MTKFQQNRLNSSKVICRNTKQISNLKGITFKINIEKSNYAQSFSNLVHLLFISQKQHLTHVNKKSEMMLKTVSYNSTDVLKLEYSKTLWNLGNSPKSINLKLEFNKSFIYFMQKYVWNANFDYFLEGCTIQVQPQFQNASEFSLKACETLLRSCKVPVRLISLN